MNFFSMPPIVMSSNNAISNQMSDYFFMVVTVLQPTRLPKNALIEPMLVSMVRLFFGILKGRKKKLDHVRVGTLYGCGVYFHAHAKYSHDYTKLGVSGERTMFLARVLIGKTCIGNPSMKVPPEGFDTTTNGDHIFVVYHDAAAYGEYLITYR